MRTLFIIASSLIWSFGRTSFLSWLQTTFGLAKLIQNICFGIHHRLIIRCEKRLCYLNNSHSLYCQTNFIIHWSVSIFSPRVKGTLTAQFQILEHIWKQLPWNLPYFMHILSCVRHTLFTIDPIIACIQEGLHIAEYDVISWRKNFIDKLASLCTLAARI